MEGPLLAAVLAEPADVDRLRVYGDWLTGSGDRRAAYVAAQLALRQGGRRPELLAAARRAYPAGQRAWCGLLEQAGVFEPNLTELPSQWWGVGLSERPSQSTWQRWDELKLPPIDVERFDGSLDWLRVANSPIEGEATDDRDGWERLLERLAEDGLHIPPALRALMADGDLQRQLPSCTANFFLCAADTFQLTLADGSTLLTFYSDQQWCVLWGVRLSREDRYAPVLAGPPTPDRENNIDPLSFESPSLEDFLYRSWLENCIWFAQSWEDARRPLTPEEQAYMAALRAARRD